jgi:ATP-dependent RNA helicase HelY
MPARTVVLEKLEKFNGEARVPLTAGEYTQLTGRAGRRGIDVEGHSLIQWSAQLDPAAVAALASRRTYPLNSSFKPTYNMAINLIERFGRDRTRDILENSFAQFQADRSVVDLARKVKQQEETLAGYAAPMECHLGDFAEYSLIRRELTDLEKQKDVSSRALKEKRNAELNALRKKLKSHSCHQCPDRETHARWAERWWRLKRDTDKIVQQITTRTGAVARIFDRVCEVLVDVGYLLKDPQGTDYALTPQGEYLGRIYGERDLLVAESIRQGLWNELDAPSLAAMACAIVFEPRREEGVSNERYLPQGKFLDALHETQQLWSDIDELENYRKLPGSLPLATGLCLPMYKWAKGTRLDDVLFEADMPAGDFVRWSKQTIDLLDQLAHVSQDPLRTTAHVALDSVRRGIVAYSSVV